MQRGRPRVALLHMNSILQKIPAPPTPRSMRPNNDRMVAGRQLSFTEREAPSSSHPSPVLCTGPLTHCRCVRLCVRCWLPFCVLSEFVPSWIRYLPLAGQPERAACSGARAPRSVNYRRCLIGTSMLWGFPSRDRQNATTRVATTSIFLPWTTISTATSALPTCCRTQRGECWLEKKPWTSCGPL